MHQVKRVTLSMQSRRAGLSRWKHAICLRSRQTFIILLFAFTMFSTSSMTWSLQSECPRSRTLPSDRRKATARSRGGCLLCMIHSEVWLCNMLHCLVRCCCVQAQQQGAAQDELLDASPKTDMRSEKHQPCVTAGRWRIS
jgi:hypothetical protein